MDIDSPSEDESSRKRIEPAVGESSYQRLLVSVLRMSLTPSSQFSPPEVGSCCLAIQETLQLCPHRLVFHCICT